jgi:hypothetical protein
MLVLQNSYRSLGMTVLGEPAIAPGRDTGRTRMVYPVRPRFQG